MLNANLLMRQPNNLWFRSSVLFVFCSVFFSFKTSAQADTSLNINRDLLALYQQAISYKPIAANEPCSIQSGIAAGEIVKQALSLDALGNWLCCKTMLYSFLKNIKPAHLEACHLHLALAEYFTSHQSYDSAKAYANLANKEARERNWLNEQAQALLLLSTGGLKRRNISAAYLWADSALVIARRTQNENLQCKILYQLALCARRHFTSISQRSFPYYLLAREKALSTSDSFSLCNIDMFLGADNFELNRWAEGLSYIREGVTLSLRNKNLSQAYLMFVVIGYALNLKDHPHEALEMFQKALAVSQQQQQPYNTQGAYHQISETYLGLKQYDSSLLYADLSGRVPGIDSFWANVYDLKAPIYDAMGNAKMAASMYKKSVEWFREDFLYRNQDQLSGYEAKLNTKEKEIQVAQEKKHALQLEWMIGGIAGLLVISAWAVVWQRRAKRRVFRQHIVIQKQRSELQKSLGEKEILLKEIHHRVKNNLSVISSLLELQSSGLSDETAKAAIAVGQNRVASIALIHQRLYQHENLAAIELSGFLQDLFRQVSSIFKKPLMQIEMKSTVPETLLDIDTAVPFGLIMNELLTNSFKYAFVDNKTGIVTIDLQKQNAGDFILTYADNGPGITQEVNMKSTTSLGMRLIHRLSKQLGGSATYLYNNGKHFHRFF